MAEHIVMLVCQRVIKRKQRRMVTRRLKLAIKGIVLWLELASLEQKKFNMKISSILLKEKSIMPSYIKELINK